MDEVQGTGNKMSGGDRGVELYYNGIRRHTSPQQRTMIKVAICRDIPVNVG